MNWICLRVDENVKFYRTEMRSFWTSKRYIDTTNWIFYQKNILYSNCVNYALSACIFLFSSEDIYRMNLKIYSRTMMHHHHYFLKRGESFYLFNETKKVVNYSYSSFLFHVNSIFSHHNLIIMKKRWISIIGDDRYNHKKGRWNLCQNYYILYCIQVHREKIRITFSVWHVFKEEKNHHIIVIIKVIGVRVIVLNE